MSDNILQPDPEALHQSAIDILTHVSNVMAQGSTLLKEHDRLLTENQSEYRLGNEIEAVEQDLRYVKSDLEKVKQRELTMTIVAPTSAGKSMIINTIAGQELLPSRKTPMTILPTEIVFCQSATQAKLILNETLISHLLEVWRQLHDRIQQIGEMEAINRAINAGFICEDLVNQIAENPTPAIEAVSIGSQLIESNLTTVNDVFRLANILGVPTDFLSSLTQIPRIEAPFHAKLSSLQSLDKLVLVDTPGITEYNSSNLTDLVIERY
jgi:DNA-binding FrmR family transcriptional regulator